MPDVDLVEPAGGRHGSTNPDAVAADANLGRPGSTGADRIQVLQQIVSGQLDLLVAPLRCAVDRRDESCAMQPVEVAVDEGISGLRLVRGADGETEMPGGVFGPCVLLDVCVLCRCVRLRVAPIAVQDVLTFID